VILEEVGEVRGVVEISLVDGLPIAVNGNREE
jgi:hypothetical protein